MPAWVDLLNIYDYKIVDATQKSIKIFGLHNYKIRIVEQDHCTLSNDRYSQCINLVEDLGDVKRKLCLWGSLLHFGNWNER